MKILEKSALGLILSAGLAVGTVTPLLASPAGWFQEYPSRYMDMRGVVDRTQSDLRAAAELEHGNNKQRDRYHDAQERLSDFDRKLTKGHFDKGDLEHAVDKIKDILDHNVLQASSRDALMRDVTDLKVARDRRW